MSRIAQLMFHQEDHWRSLTERRHAATLRQRADLAPKFGEEPDPYLEAAQQHDDAALYYQPTRGTA